MTVAAQAPVDSGSELRVLTTGATDRVYITDKSGAKHLLNALDLSDLCEYEDKFSASLLGTNVGAMKLRDIAFLLYLSLRKEDRSPEDIDARRWKYTERQVLMMFDLSFMAKSPEVFLDLLRLSGLEIRPQTASQPEEKTQA